MNEALGTAQNPRQLAAPSSHARIPGHILAFLLVILPWRPSLRHHLLCRGPGTFLISVNPVSSQVCRHRAHSNGMRCAGRDVDGAEEPGPGFFHARLGHWLCTHAWPDHTRGRLLNGGRVSECTSTYQLLPPCTHHSQTQYVHATHCQAGWL